MNTLILLEEVWDTLHNFLVSNETRTAIWEQLHLNFYTQYSYNKWHKATDLCPLCQKVPESIFHIILHCDFVNTIWSQIQPALLRLSTKTLDDTEKALGIVQIKSAPGTMLRNWLGYKLREQILLFERTTYHQSKKASEDLFKTKFNQNVARDVKDLMYRFNNEANLAKFDKIVAWKGILCQKICEGKYSLKKVFN